MKTKIVIKFTLQRITKVDKKITSFDENDFVDVLVDKNDEKIDKNEKYSLIKLDDNILCC